MTKGEIRMPIVDMSVEKLLKFEGCNPRPADIEEYWDRAIAEMEAEKVGVITREPSQEEMETVGFEEMAVVDLSDKFDEEE